ncbi:hypothetical protein [Rhizobium lentis]|uniref:hypothetical protein n=1 Tax=Rhizobium lentis TaxID=1138194 RepID=UPI001C8383A6|nr:hypothetical protein [Rhizobium lentis]MBX5144961.1 hypothetical protein [Rhizobium lentis]
MTHNEKPQPTLEVPAQTPELLCVRASELNHLQEMVAHQQKLADEAVLNAKALAKFAHFLLTRQG